MHLPHRPGTDRTRDRALDAGFTLIELLVVITILGILAGIVVFAVNGLGDKGRTSAVAEDARTLRTAEEAYCAKHSKYTDIDGLFGEKLIASTKAYNSISLGRDGVCGPAGDDDTSFSLYDATAPTAFEKAIDVGTTPIDVAVDSKTNMIYVANRDSNDVTVIDGNTDTVVGSPIAVGALPESIAVNESNDKIYVGFGDTDNETPGGVSIIDGGSRAILKTIDYPVPATEVAVNPVNGDVYVGSDGCCSNDVLIIDPSSNNAQTIDTSAAGGILGPSAFTFDTKTNQVLAPSGAFIGRGIVVIDGNAPHGVTHVRFSNLTSGNGATSGAQGSVIAVDSARNKAYMTQGIQRPDSFHIWQDFVVVDLTAIHDQTTDGVTVIDPSSPPGAVSVATGIDPGTGKVFFETAGASPQIRIFDGATNSFTGGVPAAPPQSAFNPPQNVAHMLTVNPGTNRVYYPAKGFSGAPGGLMAFDADLKLPTTIRTGHSYGSSAIDTKTNKLYITAPNDNTVSVVK